VIPAARPLIGREERDAVDCVLQSGMLAQGPEVAAFEKEFATIVEGRACVAVNSGTSALHLALLALGIGPRDEVIIPSFSFAATANVIHLTGATAVFADIEPDYFALDPAAVESAITPRTKAVMPVHLYGHPAAMERFRSIAQQHGLLLVEDAAQAVGASINGVPIGAWGDSAGFSFYPTKNMTTGEGGMVAMHSDSDARLVRLYRNQGMERRYENEVVGFNNRMTDLHAAIGRVQLTKLAEWTAIRQANAAFLSAHLSGVETPLTAPGVKHVFHQYTIRVIDHDRGRFAAELAKRGVGTGVYYPVPIHRLPPFDVRIDLPETERASAQVLSLPVYPGLSKGELDAIVDAVNGVASAGS
jgi:perosamine synthetase